MAGPADSSTALIGLELTRQNQRLARLGVAHQHNPGRERAGQGVA
jgi:hypothetical protein